MAQERARLSVKNLRLLRAGTFVSQGGPMNAHRNGTLVAAVIASLAGAAPRVLAQPGPTQTSAAEEIVVTGTSIRGVAPVGSNVITVDRAQIESSGGQTIQEVLSSVPAVTGFGNSAQGAVGQGGGGAGGFQSFDGAGSYAPTIHGLGASASNGTLILIDGHRLPLSGINHTRADPTVIAPRSIERVEILPDGASAVYGSDAVAGVLNFITRKNFSGVEGNLQAAFGGDGYSTTNAGIVAGFDTNEGSVMISYNYSTRDALQAGARPFTAADHRTQGGGNFASFNCAPASVSPATGQPGAGLIFAYPYNGAGIVNNAANGFCDFSGLTDLVPEDNRNNLLIKIERPVNENLTLSGDVVYARQRNVTAINRGSVTATVYGPGSVPAGGAGQINPFFAGPTGANTETVRFQADELFGPGAKFTGGADSLFATATAEWRFANDWRANVGATVGRDDSQQRRDGALCASCALLALNGTMFNIGGGSARLAAGIEYLAYSMDENVTRERGTGPASTNSLTTFLTFDRDVTSEFVELFLPIVSAANSHKGLRELNMNVSARHDDYSDFGGTTNPRFGIDWSPIDALRVRANYAESFTAPALTSRGGINGVTAESSFGGLLGQTAAGVNANMAIPNTYPGAIGLPGCTAATPTCLINAATVPGVVLAGGNDQLTAQEGETSSIGIDFTPKGLSGLRVSVTYWTAKYKGAITAPQAAFAISSPDLNSLLQLYPGGVPPATLEAASAGLPQTAPLAATSYFIYSFKQRNAFNLDADGVDADVRYHADMGIGAMDFGLALSHKLKMDQQFGTGGEVFSVLNTIGINTTFPSNETAARLSVDWQRSAISARLAVNYAGDYLNWNGSAPFPVIRSPSFAPIGGGQPVDSYATVDLRFAYDFKGPGALSGASAFFDVRDLFDEGLPFVNAPIGFDPFNANPIGRVLTVGINKKW